MVHQAPSRAIAHEPRGRRRCRLRAQSKYDSAVACFHGFMDDNHPRTAITAGSSVKTTWNWAKSTCPCARCRLEANPEGHPWRRAELPQLIGDCRIAAPDSRARAAPATAGGRLLLGPDAITRSRRYGTNVSMTR